ncbi:dynein light chain [Mycotypha africana]|uniref:dynein light chain n=1 Tax=Mycotypha africana TaxID=64632 RepID=UPI00230168D9|nr:dynein light chain [Mycotypha africana]KAI8973804.1 dynein light chain [Mycotypha africana]
MTETVKPLKICTADEKFTADEIQSIIKDTVEQVLNNEEYAHSKVPQWNSNIIDACLTKLKEGSKNHKYIVTCIILQNKGAGFYAGSTVYWDNQNDASASYRFESKSMFAIVNVFALSLP